MERYEARTGVRIPLGVQGENRVREIYFPEAYGWENEFGIGGYTALYRRPGETESYPVPVIAENGVVYIVVGSNETFVDGAGMLQLIYRVDEVDKRSLRFNTHVERSLGRTTVPPADIVPYMNSIIASGAGAQAAKILAEAAANNAAESLQELKDGIASGDFKGDKGDKGDPGEKGEKGDPGRTPVKGVDYFTPSELDAVASDAAAKVEPEISRLSESISETAKDVETEHKKNTEQDRRLANLEAAAMGVLHREVTDTDEAYEKTLPSGINPYGMLDKVGGKTIVWNQLLKDKGEKVEEAEEYEITVPNKAVEADVQMLGGKSVKWNQLYSEYTTTSQVGGVTRTLKDGVTVLNGTTISESGRYSEMFNTVLDRVYYSAFFGTALTKVTRIQGTYNSFRPSTVGLAPCIHKCTMARVNTYTQIYYEVGTTFENDTFYGVIVDLTAMFGSGNEPTSIDDPRIKWIEQYAAEHPEYNAGEIVHADVDKVVEKGKNLIPYPYLGDSYSGGGVTMSVGTDGSIEVKGTATGSLYPQFRLQEVELDAGTYCVSLSRNSGATVDALLYVGTSWTEANVVSATTAKAFTLTKKTKCYIRVATPNSGTMNEVIKPLIEKGSTATDYTPYHTPTDHPITEAIRKLDGYGWGVNGVYNEVDFTRKKFVKRVDRVDLGGLTFTRNEAENAFRSSISKRKYANGNFKLITSSYPTYTDNHSTGANMSTGGILHDVDKYLFVNSGSATFYIRDTKYESIAEFVDSVRGVYVYYELATPIETDISDILDTFTVEEGGSITFVNDALLDVPAKVSYGVTEWSQPIDSTHKYIHNGVSVTGASSVDVVSGDTLHDLTKMFGSGSEPTQEQFNAITVGADKTYNEGELKSATNEKVVLTGSNVWDEEWEQGYLQYLVDTDGFGKEGYSTTQIRNKGYIKVSPNTTYVNVNPARNTLFKIFYDADKNPIKVGANGYISASSFTTTEDTQYIRFYVTASYGNTYKNDIAIFRGSAKPYTPYHRTDYDLSQIISKYFPNGMKSAGSVYDYIDLENKVAVQRVGVDTVGNIEVFAHSETIRGLRVKGLATESDYLGRKVGVAIGEYEPSNNISISATTMDDKSWLRNGGVLYIRDTAYTDANAFKADKSEVSIYYELAEPIVTPITEDISPFVLGQLEANGSLTFVSNLDAEGIHLPVPNEEYYLVNVKEALANG